MSRPLPPLWLAAPSRFAGLPKRGAAIVAALMLALVLAILMSPAHAPQTGGSGLRGASDLALHESVIDGLRAGGDYYQLTADTLRAGSYPLRPFLAFRLPTHSVVQAALPPDVTILLLYLLALGVAAAWWHRLTGAMRTGVPLVIAMILLVGGLIAFVQKDLIAFPEVWAGLLLALALALREPGRWGTALAIGIVAMLVCETAALLPVVMAMTALADGERREAAAWSASLGALVLVLAAHAHAVGLVTGPLDTASPDWAGLLGFGFGFRALVGATALAALPGVIALVVAVLAMLGWSAWRGARARRVLALLGGYVVVLALFARTDSFYWALLPAPLSLVGLAFLPDAVRDLAHGLLDRRRVRVQRITQ